VGGWQALPALASSLVAAALRRGFHRVTRPRSKPWETSQWVTLNTYAFTAGTAGNVVFRTKHANGTNTNGYVVADAVRFVRQ
jgi:hypothetical protein